MYRCHPQTARLVELVRTGAIGEVRLIRCSFSFEAGLDPSSRLIANALGGGGILDVGSYCMSMARLIAGATRDLPFAEPLSIKAVGHLEPTEGTGLYSVAALDFGDGLLAELTTGVRLTQPNTVTIEGSAGRITVTNPWFAGTPGSRIIVDLGEDDHGESDHREINTETDENAYQFEIDTVARHLAARSAPSPAMSPADTLGNMRALDAWRREVGVIYEADED